VKELRIADFGLRITNRAAQLGVWCNPQSEIRNPE